MNNLYSGNIAIPNGTRELTHEEYNNVRGGCEKEPFHEIFKSPFEKEKSEDAEKILNDIRSEHPAAYGWTEINGYIEELSNGKYRAVREHKKEY